MTIGFLRHAEAEDGKGSDFDRKLTPKGLDQAAKAGKFCLRNGLLPDLIITSPLVRARQTAGIVAEITGCDLIEGRWLACGMEPADCLREIAVYSHKNFVLLVGHEPDFSSAIAGLLGLPDPSALKIRKASLTVLDLVEPGPGCGQLQFLIPARLMS
ncbi:MAG: phosphoglycerate mutase family protein [Terrimicrobiaceae bacterium]|nr:histidine phosphatase family protein [Terrimicrobiaceae bacterium]